MKSLWQDLRFGLRTLKKSPAFTFIAMLTLALGIGANSTIFSWISSTLLNPIPGARDAHQLVSVAKGEVDDFSYLDYRDLREESRSFTGLAASKMIPLDLSGTGHPVRIWGQLVSANFFEVLGVHPVLGRGFLPEDDTKPNGAPYAVISYRLWQTRFAGSESAVGRTLSLNKHPYTIVGVTDRFFQGSDTGLRADLWLPMMMAPELMSDPQRVQSRSEGWLELTGRLKPGVTAEQAQEELSLRMRRIVGQFPNAHQGNNDVIAAPLWRAPYGANSRLSVLLPPLLAISAIVLLLACANVANLLLVRSLGRRREIAVRMSLGASRWRLARLMLMESLLLALGGGGSAILIASWTSGTFSNFIPPSDLPIALNMRVDRAVFLGTLAISFFACLIAGALPAFRSSALAPVDVLKEDAGSISGGLHKARLTRGLVVAQIALSLSLLVSAGLFIRSIRRAQLFNPGFNASQVLLESFDLLPEGYAAAEGQAFDRELLAKLEATPGVETVSLSDWAPLSFSFSTTTLDPAGYLPQPHESMDVLVANIAPNYFRTMQVPLLEGRDFTLQDKPDTQRVAIVNQALAQRYWPHENALGRRIHAYHDWYTIVGISQSTDALKLGEAPRPFLYLPLFQEYSHREIIHARVAGDPLGFAATAERIVHELNADLPVYDVTSLAQQVQLSSIGFRVAGTFVGAFGLLALILAAVGIYGVISYSTRQRTREIGIRMALGAQADDVLRLVLSGGLRMTVLGLAIGLGVSVGLARYLRMLLFGVGATDPLAYTTVIVLLFVVAAAACYFPARRASRVSPLEALRHE
ncbi:MAG TPA: ABC transporter permease [Candidatus Acidoferrales bacterium]|nr:ABC transporter permease [Candidatus Acidoferrales bacterium]